jgi:copper chaperone CopZ
MKTENITIANLKCHGCAATIRKELMELNGVKDVSVDMDHDVVTVVSDGTDRKVLTAKLYSLGYPEATEENGLLLQLKSYGSCVVGRIENLKTH